MVDVLLNTENVVVLGPPDQIDVLVDIGPQGIRGNKIIVGEGNPNEITTDGVILEQSLILNDIYINTSPGADYGYMYQYISAPGGNTWDEALRVSPAIYSSIKTVQFTSGSGSITIPISNIVTVTGSPLSASNFSIQYQIEGTTPIASSLEIPELAGSGTNLVININAAHYSSGSWATLPNGLRKVHVFISIV
jgi:hypothetical protein